MAKLILGRIPFKHQLFRSLHWFRHGQMDDPSYALKIFHMHFKKAFPQKAPNQFAALELGPGDSLASALIAKAHGAGKVYLVDVGAYADRNIKTYRRIARHLRQNGLSAFPNMDSIDSVEEMLQKCNASYLTDGSLKNIPDASVDFIWSHSVLEHIRKRDFAKTMAELHRILKKDGRASHNVDLQDHLQHSLHSLRFSPSLWENNLFANSGFYTNRLRYSESLRMMKKAGFKILHTNRGYWKALPLPRKNFHPEFRHLTDDELRICTYSVLLEAIPNG